MPQHPHVEAWVEKLLAQGVRPISLDEVAEVIGAAAVTPPDIEAVVDRLLAAGCSVGDEEQGSATQALLVVLRTARELRAELGRAPSSVEIAERSGLSLGEVKGALLFAQVMQR